MIGYVTLGSNDLQRAAAFYDTLLAGIGASRLWEMDRGICWGTHPERPQLAIMRPFNGEPATAGNGVMVGFYLDNRADVDKLHAHALQLGSQDEARPACAVTTSTVPISATWMATSCVVSPWSNKKTEGHALRTSLVARSVTRKPYPGRPPGRPLHGRLISSPAGICSLHTFAWPSR